MHWTFAHTSPEGQSAAVLQPATQLDSLPQETQTWPLPQSASVRHPPPPGASPEASLEAVAVGGGAGASRAAHPPRRARTTTSDTLMGIVHLPTRENVASVQRPGHPCALARTYAM